MSINRIVDSWSGGTWAIRQMLQTPPLSVHPTFQEAVDAAIAEVAHGGGGEVIICDQQGQVRDRRAVSPTWPVPTSPRPYSPAPAGTAGSRPHPNGPSARSSSGRNWKRIAEVFGLVSVVVGIVFTVLAYVRPSPPPARNGQIDLVASSAHVLYYPPNGQLPSPSNPPPDSSGGPLEYHCSEWQEWFKENSIVPREAMRVLRISASSTSPISIVRITTDVLGKKPSGGSARIRCGYGASGFPPHTLRIDLDNSAVPVLERGNFETIGPLPPSSFRVDQSAAETLDLVFEGSEENYVYECSIRVEYAENGENKVAEFGTPADPVVLLPIDQNYSNSSTYVWSMSEKKWVVAPIR